MKNLRDDFRNLGLLWLRILMGSGIAFHGYGKILGGSMDGFAQLVDQMGFPYPVLFAWGAASSEFLGGICIAAGLFTRVAAFFIFVTMSVAAFIKHGMDPFKVKELALAYWTMAGTLFLTGAGKFSLDWIVFRRFSGLRGKSV